MNNPDFVLKGFDNRLDLAISKYNAKYSTSKPITLAELARLIGVKYRNLVDWKKGLYKPKIEYLIHISSILESDPQWLITGVSIPSKVKQLKNLKKELIKNIETIDNLDQLLLLQYTFKNIKK